MLFIYPETPVNLLSQIYTKKPKQSKENTFFILNVIVFGNLL